MTGRDEYYPRDRSIHPVAHAPGYKTSVTRAPRFARLSIEPALPAVSGPVSGGHSLGRLDNDLIRNFAGAGGDAGGEAIGERIIVHGRVLDENARPVPDALVEVWQANAGGKYRHVRDRYLAPLDPNFGGW